MSNKRKMTRMKGLAPTRAEAVQVFEKAAQTNDQIVVPSVHEMSRARRRQMRATIPVLRALIDSHVHGPNCKHAKEMIES